jgi:negative regulator of flagellin synthesis FlgM
MSIEINGMPPAQVHGTTDDSKLGKPAGQPAVEQETGKSSTNDTVSLSDSAVKLGKLDNTAVSAPVVDTQRVEQVKQAIREGSYEVDPAKVADKLMQFESILKSAG